MDRTVANAVVGTTWVAGIAAFVYLVCAGHPWHAWGVLVVALLCRTESKPALPKARCPAGGDGE